MKKNNNKTYAMKNASARYRHKFYFISTLSLSSCITKTFIFLTKWNLPTFKSNIYCETRHDTVILCWASKLSQWMRKETDSKFCAMVWNIQFLNSYKKFQFLSLAVVLLVKIECYSFHFLFKDIDIDLASINT